MQKIGELKQIPERPRFSARMGQLLGGGDGDVVSPSPSPKKPPPREKPHKRPDLTPVLTPMLKPTRDGKATLTATSDSVHPVYRDNKSVELGGGAPPGGSSGDADDARPSGMSASAADMGDSAAVVNASDAFVNEMMQLLDSDNLRALKQHFGKYKDELDIYTFVSVMRQFLPKKAPLAADPATLVANLKELFEQVDVNGDS